MVARPGSDLAVPAEICLMHLVWAPLGPGVLADFLGAYRDRRLGSEHDLVVLLNGFGS